MSNPELFRERLEEMLYEKRMNAVQLSAASGVNTATISQYRSGCYVPKSESLNRLAAALGVSPAWLSGEEGAAKDPEERASCSVLPVYDSYPSDGKPLKYVVCDSSFSPDEYFFLLTDNNLYPAVGENDLALIKKCSALTYGDVGLIDCGDGGRLYYYNHLGGGGISLATMNPYTPPMTIAADLLSTVQILGRVVYTIKKW